MEMCDIISTQTKEVLEMAITDAQKRAVKKYRKSRTHALVIYFPNKEYDRIDVYCKYINSPVATFVRKLIRDAIDSDPTFTYNLEDDIEPTGE